MSPIALNALHSLRASSRLPTFGETEAGSGLRAKSAHTQINDPADVSKAAKQFEAILVRQMIGPAIEPLMSGSSLAGKSAEGMSSGGGVYGYMLTDVLANALTAGQGLGMAKLFESQLSPAAAPPDATAQALLPYEL